MLDVLGEGALAAEIVDHHRVVDDEIDRRQRIDLLRVAAELLHRVAHGGEVDDRGHAGEVLHQHARRAIGDLAVGAAVLQPGGDRLDVVDRDGAAVLVAQQVLQQHLQRDRQARDVAEAGLLGGGQAEIVVGTRRRPSGCGGSSGCPIRRSRSISPNNGCAPPTVAAARATKTISSAVGKAESAVAIDRWRQRGDPGRYSSSPPSPKTPSRRPGDRPRSSPASSPWRW